MANVANFGGQAKASHTFAQIPSATIPRSKFDRSHGIKTTFDSGYLIPIYMDEALPGDTFSLRMQSFCRMATPIAALMDNLYMDFFFFAVPNRLLWDNWKLFMGERVDPADDPSIYSVPIVTAHSIAEQTLQDYLCLPVGRTVEYNALHTRAYNLIWNEWFRDQNLQDSVVVDTDNGPDTYTDYVLLRRGKRHDYFTSCLPWPQKGDPVAIPLGTTAPVVGTGNKPLVDIGTSTDLNMRGINTDGNVRFSSTPASSGDLYWGSDTGLEADLTNAAAATINDIRQAFQIQKLLERDARGGTRYTEIVRSHFSVISPDARMQRPEYLGGGSTRINIHPVSSTNQSANVDLGELAAFGTQASDGIGFTKSFTEHCTLLGLVNVRADLTYQQGKERMWDRQSRYDYYWPSLAQIGEQAVLSREIYSTGAAGDTDVFGYQERYGEYRYKQSRVTGEFRSAASTPLDLWHLALDFASRPTLNDTFIQDQPPIDRVVQVPSEPEFIGDFFFDLKCARPMPTYGVPGLIDHF